MDDTQREKEASLSPTADTITLFAEQWDQNPLFAVAEITETPFVADEQLTPLGDSGL